MHGIVLTQILCAATRLIVRGMSVIEAEGVDVGPSELQILVQLDESPGRTASWLGRAIGRDKTTLSRSISKLARAGLVTSELDLRDGRRRLLFLTAEGQRVVHPVTESLRLELEAVTADMPRESVDIVRRTLEQLCM